MMVYEPLHDPTRPLPEPASLDIAIALARQVLDETAGLNIHSRADMEKAADTLNFRLRALLAALDAERGERS
ncbi:hypothetical protein ACPCSD_14680 [Streptomyces griseoincarnatus]